MSLTTALQNSILDGYFATEKFLSLHTGQPGASGSHANEVAGGGYARQSLTGKLSAASGGIVTNTGTITFPAITAEYGAVTDFATESALIGGVMGITASFTSASLKTVGQTYQFPPGTIRFQIILRKASTMSASDVFENDLLKLLFTSTAIAAVADNAGSAPNTNLYFALHTADPGEAGTQNTSECNYTGYARVAVPRDSTGFQVTGSSVSPKNNVNFPIATGGSNTASYFSIGTAASGAGKILVSGTVTPAIVITSGVTPVLVPATAVTID